MKAWKLKHENRRCDEEIADNFFRSSILHRHHKIWLRQAQHKMAEHEQRLAVIELRAIDLARMSAYSRLFTRWLHFQSNQREEKMKLRLKELTLRKVDGWLKDFKSETKTQMFEN